MGREILTVEEARARGVPAAATIPAGTADR
jgi:hypothetical protein